MLRSSDDEDSSSEEERKRKAKFVPMWARPEVVKLALVNQTQDPDDIFGDLSKDSPDLEGTMHLPMVHLF